MIDRRIGKIKVRKGTDLQRKQIVFEEGELVYTTDTKRVFIGDGITLGGKRVTNKNYIFNSAYLPNDAYYGDIVHDLTNKKTYIVGTDDGRDILNPSLKLILIAEYNISNDYQTRIDELTNKFKSLETCLRTEKPKQPDPTFTEEFKWLIHPISKRVIFGLSVTFTAKAIGPFNDITYKWQKLNIDGNYIDIPDKLGDSFDIFSVVLEDISYYRCVATSRAGIIYSNPAELYVDSNFLLAENSFYIRTEKGEYIKIE
jgi:hypothetical protein